LLALRKPVLMRLRLGRLNYKDMAAQGDSSGSFAEGHNTSELLSVLLEVCAHVDAISAQMERVRTQLERLDARVGTLERKSTAARDPPTATARGRALALLGLPPDVLNRWAKLIDPATC
jgi:hypothetical protein